MMRIEGLGRQVALSMAFVAIATVLMTYIGFYALYVVIVGFFPEAMPNEDALIPSGTELLALAIIAMFVLVGAVIAATRLARRIVIPLNSVADAARRIASGELEARAQPGDRTLGETVRLVDDFNGMADRLEKVAADVVTWNAQIAHELRTPLTILRGRLQGLIDGVFQPDEALFRRLLGQVEGLSRLVEDLRVVSLVDSGRLDLHLTEVELAEEIEDLVDLMEPALLRAGFTISMNLASGRARLDMPRIRQAMMALLDNVQKHADPCRVKIDLKFRRGSILCSVTDQGPGLPPSFQGDAFNIFARGPQLSESGYVGTGLGLSVVQAIARAHGGHVTYAHDPRGSAFTLELPRTTSPGTLAPDL